MKGANKRKKASREAPKVDPETTVSLECPTSPPDVVEEQEEDERSEGEGDRNDDADSVASSSKSLRDRKPRRTSTRNEEKSQVR